ncbi:MAG: ATP-dependent Clp protease proteolytic subunit [bacterium]
MADMNENKRNTEEKKEGSPALTGRLLESRCIVLSSEINQEVAHSTISQLLVLAHESNDNIRVFISSQGGHVDSGFAIHDVMRLIKPRVITVALGWVASMGVPIFLGGEKGYRYCLPHARFMLHQPSQGVLGQASDIEIEAKEILRIRERINQLISKATNQPMDRVEKDSDRNFWMSAEQALEYGLVDKIIEMDSDMSAKTK